MHAKTWFITGCSTGFGRAIAIEALARGECVVATARKPETLASLVEAQAERALAMKLDVTVPDEIESAIAAARRRFGAIDVLVNNAGYGQFGSIEDTPIEAARAMMETNLFGALAMIKAVLPEMVERRSGQIVNIGSVSDQIGFPLLGYYATSKFAVAGLTESLAAEVAPLGISATLVELGPFQTDFVQGMKVCPPSPHYDPAALSQAAGTDRWNAGDDARLGASVLLEVLADPSPPVRLVLGGQGFDVIELHDARRRKERERWMAATRLETPAKMGLA